MSMGYRGDKALGKSRCTPSLKRACRLPHQNEVDAGVNCGGVSEVDEEGKWEEDDEDDEVVEEDKSEEEGL